MFYTERQTEALGGSGAAPCAVTADCCGYDTPAEVITPDQCVQAVAGARQARPGVRGPASAEWRRTCHHHLTLS